MPTGLKNNLLARLARLHAHRAYKQLVRDAQNATAVQDRLLLSLIRPNARSGFGKAHGFASIRSYADFVKSVPICTYADLSPWVDKVKAGDTSAMFGRNQRVRMFAMTSGTIDKPKYVPVTDRFLKDQRAGWHAFGIKALSDHPTGFFRSIVQVTSPMDEERTPAGVPCGAITGMMAATQKKIVQKYYVAPLPVAYISDTAARRYTIMRLAIPADVSWLVTASPATVLQLARTGQEHAESIIRDVRDGTLTREMDIPDHVRDALAERLVPDPVSASRLEAIVSRRGALLPKDYWSLDFIANWMGGTMGLYLRDYPQFFGDTPVRDIGLIATEGRMSIPLSDGTPAGVAAVSTMFLEFIPAGEYGSQNPTVLRTHELSIGQEYFVLLTTSAGFYRYDISDCVRVVAYNGQAPVFEFLHKGARISSLTGEKITENQVVIAFGRATANVGEAVSDFVFASVWSDPPYYRLYIEETPDLAPSAQRGIAVGCDEHLCEVNIEYASKRSTGRLGPVEVVALGVGTFKARARELASRHRESNEQYKHQFLYTKPGEDEPLSALARSFAQSRSAVHHR
jgi:GH3 auxin-responsive promoter